MAAKKLLDQVRDVLYVKHYSLKTEKAYIHWIYRFIRYHQKRHPRDMGEKEISWFLTHLTRDIHSPHICWKTAMISGRFRSCWDTTMSKPQ
jgi:hypothetical protein